MNTKFPYVLTFAGDPACGGDWFEQLIYAKNYDEARDTALIIAVNKRLAFKTANRIRQEEAIDYFAKYGMSRHAIEVSK